MAEINAAQMRDALAWVTNDQEKAKEPSTNPFVWFWEAVQGDFNEDRSTSQILVDAGISMIPLVDQVCDVRDLIANCKKLTSDYKDGWAWVALALTLIGLFPTLGSLVKGVLKIIFGFIRRYGANAVAKAVDDAMTWVITFLRRRDVQKYLQAHKVDEVFKWLAKEVKEVRGKISVKELTGALDRAIKVLEALVNKVSFIPVAGKKAKAALEQVREIRLMADKYLAEHLKLVTDAVDTFILALERKILEQQHGILDAGNVHFRGALPAATAVALMQKRKPGWLSKTGDKFIKPAELKEYRSKIDKRSAQFDPITGKPRPKEEIFPYLNDQNIQSFHKLASDTIKGPARLFRILAPNSRGMSDCWISQEVFERLQKEPDPKAAWRKFLGVWPDWNVNGQFVIYDLKAGESLNVWRGPTSSQTKGKKMLEGHHLEGGWEQLIFKLEKGDPRADSMLYYKVKNGKVTKLGKPMTQAEVDKITATMNDQQKARFFEEHLGLRESINHPNISGPFETGWGYSEFDGAGFADKIGLPELPGQITKVQK